MRGLEQDGGRGKQLDLVAQEGVGGGKQPELSAHGSGSTCMALSVGPKVVAPICPRWNDPVNRLILSCLSTCVRTYGDSNT